MDKVSQYRESTDSFITSKILPLGLFVFLAFNFVVLSRSSYKTFVYLSLFLPALIICLNLAADQLELYKKSIGLRIIFVFLAYMCISSLWSQDPDHVNYFKRALYILLFTVAWLRYRPSWLQFYRLFDIATVIASATVLIYIYDFYWCDDMPFSKRISGGNSFINPLLSGSMLGVFFCYAFIRMLQHFRDSKKCMLFATLLIPLALFVWFTGSRTPLLGIAVVVLIQLFYSKGAGWILWFVSMLLFVCGLIYFGPDHRILDRGVPYRFDIWLSIIDAWTDAVWLGNGMGNEIQIQVKDKIFIDPHNYHLAVGYYGGIVGFVLWCACLLWSVRSALFCQNKAYRRISISLLIYGIIASSFDGSSFMGRPGEVWFILWLPIALCFKSEFEAKANRKIGY